MAQRRKPRRWPKGTKVGPDGRGGGRFAPSGASSSPPRDGAPVDEHEEQLRKFQRGKRRMTYRQVDDLLQELVRNIGQSGAQHASPTLDRLLDTIDKELLRRDREAEHWQRVYESIEAEHPGWDPKQIYAEAHGLSWEQVEAEERREALLSSHPRMTFTQALHREWDDFLTREISEAEAVTRGNWFKAGYRSKQDRAARRGSVTTRVRDLWTMSAARAYAIASDDLKGFWESRPHGRITFSVFRSWYIPTEKARARAERARKAGADQAY